MTADPKKAEQVRKAYQPVRDDSTFEFTVEYVGGHDGGAMAFGLVTKGTLHEGYRLRLVRQSGEEKDCLCRAIAGASKRLSRASSEGVDKNIGIWLDIPPADVNPHDRIISFDGPTAARQVAPADLQFSILHGVQARDWSLGQTTRTAMSAPEQTEQDDWQKVWDARISALTPILGRPADTVYHATVPINLVS